MASLADQIRDYLGDKRSNAEIARLIGCRTTYVRVIRNQRGRKGRSVYDDRCLKRKYGASTMAEAWRAHRADMRARVAAR